MGLSAIASHSPIRWGLPLAIFVAVFSAFKFFDGNVSVEVRENLSRFLRSHSYETYLGILPATIQTTFTRIFGARHFSVRCVLASIVLSLISLAVTFIISLIWNYDDFIKLSQFLPTAIEKLKESQDTHAKDVREWLSHLPAYSTWLVLALSWLFWCLVPDYIALLKIRIILLVLRYTSPGLPSLVVTGVIDFIMGIWVFLASFSLLQTLIVIALLIHNESGLITGASSILYSLIIFWGIIFGIEGSILTFSSLVFFFVPVANLFWASMIPSIWLWAYIISSLFTRMLLASRPALRKLVYLLDVANHPIQSVGIVAAFIMSAGSFLMLLLLTLV